MHSKIESKSLHDIDSKPATISSADVKGTIVKEKDGKGGMYVVKRSGQLEPVHFDKITSRIRKLCYNLDREFVDAVAVSQKVCLGVYRGVTTSELDELAAETSAGMSAIHPDYGLLAARIAVSNLHKNTKKIFTDVMTDLYSYKQPKTGQAAPLLSEEVYNFIIRNKDRLNSAIVYDRDFTYDYFGFKTIERSYLLKLDGRLAERPQHMLLRVSCGIHSDDIDAAIETYELLSTKWFTHASPTLFNAGTPKPQLSSCFLVHMKNDSIEGIFDTMKDCALISKFAGGIGLSVHDIRATGSYIRGTNGTSNGLIPMLRCFNNVARYVDQCFDQHTPILTPSGMQPISRLKAGDMVISHKGTPRRVQKLIIHQVTGMKMLKLKTEDGATVVVTERHPFLCIDGNSNTINERLQAGISKLTWQDAGDLIAGRDYLARPGGKFVRLDDVSTELGAFTGELYDLEVEDDHSYVTEVGSVHNGGGKRKGSIAIYMSPHHPDIFAFLEMKLNTGSEEHRARDLFQALWVSDLFMQRVEKGLTWSLFCPDQAPGLSNVWGDEFVALYERYEKEGRAKKVVEAREVWHKILESQVETGTPYILYADSVNRKSNYSHIGTIKSSNLCVEIVEFTSPDECAVCNLASISLPKFVQKDGTYDFKKLYDVTKVITRNLNKVIDINHYPIAEAKKSNFRHRPIGIGVQGYADTLCLMRQSYEDGAQLNKDIFETIYFAALSASNELAQRDGPYPSFPGSPASKGILQFDMWNVTPSTRWDWAGLKKKIVESGLRNAMVTAPMPTATTSQMLGNNESFEPFNSNIFVRRTLAGSFICINQYLLQDLIKMGIWNDKLRNLLIANDGSVQAIPDIPDHLKKIYRTIWEVSLKCQVDQAADRGAFIDQSQSFNVHMTNATTEKLTSFHFYAWKRGLKSGCYYLRTKAAADAIKFTVDNRLLRETQTQTSLPPQTQLVEVGKMKKIAISAPTYKGEDDGECTFSCGS